MDNNIFNDEFKEVIVEFNKRMQSYFKEINKNTQYIANSLSEAMSPIAEVLKTTVVPQIDFTHLKETMALIAESIKKSLDSIEDYKRLCLSLGYPPHEDMSLPDIRGIVSTYKELNGDLDKIEPIIDKFYIEKVNIEYINDNLFTKWTDSGLLDKRLQVIEESITCFEHELYFSAIPILFSQLEGMVADAKRHKGQMGGGQLENYMNGIFNSQDNYSFNDELLQFYLNVLYVKFEHGKELDSFLSRHAIMHGADVEYGTQQNYIKLILFFDAVYDKLIVNQEKELKIDL